MADETRCRAQARQAKEFRARSAVVQALAMLAAHGPQRSREVAARLPWIEPGKAIAALSNAGVMDFADRTGRIWSITFAGRQHLLRSGIDVALPAAEAQPLPELAPLDPAECRGWAVACSATYGSSCR